jgi:hypothetical protein
VVTDGGMRSPTGTWAFPSIAISALIILSILGLKIMMRKVQPSVHGGGNLDGIAIALLITIVTE